MAATSPTTRRAPRGASAARTPKRRSLLRRVLRWLLIAILALVLACTIGGLVFYSTTKLPNPNSDFKTNTTFIYYRDGKTRIGSLSIQNRQSLDYQQIPQTMKDAAVAAENRTFWKDRGISPRGIVRSAWTIARGGEVQGGSTITQQYIKVMYLSQDRTMTRKLKELALAVKMNNDVPKQTILGDYLNTIYFGRGAYGVQAASRAYFDTDAKNLTLPQSAVLASVLNNPTIFDPKGGADAVARLTQRYHYVLDGMLQAGSITQRQHDAAARALPRFPEVPVHSTWGGSKGYLMQMVVDQLHADGFDDNQIQGGGLNVVTTFDQRLEDAAIASGQRYERIAADNAGRSPKTIHAAIASVQVGTGEVLASYGGNDDYIKNSRNWATTPRYAASTFKAWATVAALRGGLSLGTMLNGNTWTPPHDRTVIRNENGYQYGPVSLRTAVKESINTAFVDAEYRIHKGPAATIKAAEDAGLSKGAGWDENYRIPLGVAEVSPLQNAGAYATIANEGVQVPQHVVKQVRSRDGKVLFTAKTSGTQKIERDVARDTNWALESVVNPGGTGVQVADLGYPIAGKTGTADTSGHIRSAWFVAYTKQVSTAVMFVAGDDGNGSLDPYARPGDSTFFGGTYPARTWLSYMQSAMQGLPVEDLPSPAHLHGYYVPAPASSATSDGTSDNNGQGNTGQGSNGQGSNGYGSTTGDQTTSRSTSTATATSTSTATGTSTATHTSTRSTATATATGTGTGTHTGHPTSHPTTTHDSTHATSRATSTGSAAPRRQQATSQATSTGRAEHATRAGAAPTAVATGAASGR